ncbi:hypothetical protein ACFLSG_01410 [Candidatus Bipolaricaulota bacterium]
MEMKFVLRCTYIEMKNPSDDVRWVAYRTAFLHARREIPSRIRGAKIPIPSLAGMSV